MEKIEKANVIIAEYAAQGFELTLRHKIAAKRN